MFPNKTKVLKVLKIIVKLNFFIFLEGVLKNASFIGGQSAADFFWNDIVTSFVSGLNILRSKSRSFFSCTSFCMLLLKKFCRSVSVTVTKAEPMSWFIDSPVTAYSSDFLSFIFSTSLFSVISAVK